MQTRPQYEVCETCMQSCFESDVCGTGPLTPEPRSILCIKQPFPPTRKRYRTDIVLLSSPGWRVALVGELKVYWTVFLQDHPICDGPGFCSCPYNGLLFVATRDTQIHTQLLYIPIPNELLLALASYMLINARYKRFSLCFQPYFKCDFLQAP